MKLKDKYPDDLVDVSEIPVGTTLRDWHDDGVHIIIKRSNFSMNVYLGVPESHPLAGHDYDSLPIECHGGLTYGESGDGDYLPKGEFWYGYDYAHAGDYSWYEKAVLDTIGNLSEKYKDRKWSIKELVDGSWGAAYDFRHLMDLAEAIAKRYE